MPNQKNIAAVASLKEKLEKAKSLILTDYRGLTHKQLEDLHKTLRKINAEYIVVKNSLLKIASQNKAESTGSPRFAVEAGPTAILLAYEDELSPLKELFKFKKTYSKPAIKGGTVGRIVYNELEIERIAALPSKEGLIAQLMFTLNANTQKLAYLLTEINKSKSQSPIPQ